MSHISIQHCVVRSRIQNFTYVNTHDCSQSRDYKHKYLLLFLFLVRAGIQSALRQRKYVDGHRVLLKYDKKILYIFQQNCSMKPKVRKRVTVSCTVRPYVLYSVRSLYYGAHNTQFESPQVQDIFLFFKTSRPVLEPNQLPIQ
jgi:hypothetical protein